MSFRDEQNRLSAIAKITTTQLPLLISDIPDILSIGRKRNAQWKKKKPEDSHGILGLQSRTAIYNGNYKSILDIVVSGFCLSLPAEI